MLSFVKQFEKEYVIPVMKKVLSISLTFLILVAMLHLSVATHFCGGKVASSRISLSGKLASCGMEDDEKDLTPTGLHFTTHCCDNVLVFYGINSTYFPSFSSAPESYHNFFQGFSAPVGLILPSVVSVNSIYTSVSPPDISVSNKVDLCYICVFRI